MIVLHREQVPPIMPNQPSDCFWKTEQPDEMTDMVRKAVGTKGALDSVLTLPN